MKNIFKIKTLLYVTLIAFVFTSCTDEDYQKPVEDAPALTKGNADFSKFVSVGNSLTAGFTDGALFIKGQENSIPNLVAMKFAMVGGGEFTQPMMNDNNGGLLYYGTLIQPQRLYFNGVEPTSITEAPTTDITTGTPGPYNNMGVPGAKSYHLLYDGYGNMDNLGVSANPYFIRIASSSSAKVIEDAVSQQPTFFSMWIGANDVLRYAINGGDGVDQTGNSNYATYADADITDPDVIFPTVYNGLIDALTANGAKGVVLNIPDVSVLPFFTTVPYNPIPLSAAKAAYLNSNPNTVNYNNGLAYFASINVITAEEKDARTITFVEGQNPVIIEDEYLTDLTAYGAPSIRMATNEDLLVLPSMNFIGTEVDGNPLLVNGVSVPLADKWVLTKDEIKEISDATIKFNTTIKAAADAKGLAFVDANAIMNNLANGGLSFDGFEMTDQYVLGATFSLDGIHPTARGNAFIANEILKAIDAKYGSNFEVSGNLNMAEDFVTQYPENIN